MTDELIRGYIPGAIGKITELHAIYYHKHWDFGLFFESKIATELSEFLHRYHEATDGLWLARRDGEIVGSVVIDGVGAESKGGHLRWFVVDLEYQGQGVGRRLIDEAMQFCRHAGFNRVYLWTFAGLDAARHLYEQHGFTLSKEQEGRQWGLTVREQLFEALL